MKLARGYKSRGVRRLMGFVAILLMSGVLESAAPISADEAMAPKVLAAASLTFSPTSINFGKDPVGDQTGPQTVTLTNTGDGTLSLQFIGSVGPDRGEFGILTNTCGSRLNAGASCTLGIVFAPFQYGEQRGWIYVVDNASNSPQTFPLYGRGVH